MKGRFEFSRRLLLGMLLSLSFFANVGVNAAEKIKVAAI